jgi:serine/threonine protein kinase
MRFGTVCEVIAAQWFGAADAEPLVVKRLLPHLEEDATALAMVMREADILRSLPSPPAPRLVASDLKARAPWFAMGLVEGAPLEEAHRIRGLSAVGCALAEAVATLHGTMNAFAHGDLKPAHVRLADGAEGCVAYVMDYGNSRRLHDGGPVQPEPTGTPAYLAPERCAGQPPTQAADVYALALMIAELAGGEKFHGDRDRAMKAISGLGVEARTWLEAALAPAPETRPSAAQLACGLRTSGLAARTLIDRTEAQR